MAPLSGSFPSFEPEQVGPAKGYDRAAPFYDHWSWQAFWRANEFPLLQRRLREAGVRRILDVGAGTGAFLASLAHLMHDAELTGIDVSDGMLSKAKLRLGNRAKLLRADIQHPLPFATGSFDAVVMMRVASHLAQLETAVDEIARVLVLNGLFMATDLADTFNYVCTSIPTNSEKVRIETHRHTREEWNEVLRSRFDRIAFTDISLSAVRRPLAGHIRTKTPSSDAPVFKLITAHRRVA